MEQMTRTEEKLFGEKLAHYAGRKPKDFLQIDSFGGGELYASSTVELMHGSLVRVLIPSGVNCDEVITELKRIRAWLKKDPSLILKASERETQEAEISQLPF